MQDNGLTQVFYVALGAALALIGSIVTQAYQNLRNKKNEYWIRKLNSYQDFYQHTSQLCNLIESLVQLPDAVFWGSISAARKAAFDANFYDKKHPDRTGKLTAITSELVYIYIAKPEEQKEIIKNLIDQIDNVMQEFRKEEGL